jgi:hypothetical protein
MLLLDVSPAQFSLLQAVKSRMQVRSCFQAPVSWPPRSPIHFHLGVPWKVRSMPTLLTPQSSFGNAYRLQQRRYVIYQQCSSAYWCACSCPWRAFRAFVVIYVRNKSSLGEAFRVSEVSEQYPWIFNLCNLPSKRCLAYVHWVFFYS